MAWHGMVWHVYVHRRAACLRACDMCLASSTVVGGVPATTCAHMCHTKSLWEGKW